MGFFLRKMGIHEREEGRKGEPSYSSMEENGHRKLPKENRSDCHPGDLEGIWNLP